MTETHARIHRFLQQQTMRTLHDGKAAQPDDTYNKAGLIPFLPGTPARFLVMKPVPKHAHLPPPAFQLCKGTRMQQRSGAWRDLADNEPHSGTPETLAETALREGIEELGITLEGIDTLYDVGPYAFSSSKSRTPRAMWLFAASFKSEDALLPMQDVADTTTHRLWISLPQFLSEGRDDHRDILADIARKLGA